MEEGGGGRGELSPFCASIFPLFGKKCLILGLIDLEVGVGGGGGGQVCASHHTHVCKISRL